MAVVASKLAVANNFPDGDQAQDRTVRVCVSSKTACISFSDTNIIIKKLPPNLKVWNSSYKLYYKPPTTYLFMKVLAFEVAKIDSFTSIGYFTIFYVKKKEKKFNIFYRLSLDKKPN